jgi:hypothetical protein
MSLEQSFNQKLNLDQEISSSSSTQSDSQNTLTAGSVTFKTPISGAKGSGSNSVSVSKSGGRGRSPKRAPSFAGDSPPPPYASNSIPVSVPTSGRQDLTKNHRSVSLSPGSPNSHHRLNSPASTPPASVHLTGPGGDRVHSVRLTRKIFNNWRSACGKVNWPSSSTPHILTHTYIHIISTSLEGGLFDLYYIKFSCLHGCDESFSIKISFSFNKYSELSVGFKIQNKLARGMCFAYLKC